MTLILQHHLVRLVCDRPVLMVRGLIGSDSTPFSTGGRGGWQAVSRTRRSAIVEWAGPEAESYTLTMRLLADARVSDNIDAALVRLERMSRMPSENVAPPVIRVEGLVPAAGRRWVIQDFQIDETERDEQGRYLSLLLTVDLLAAENTGDGVVVARRAPSVHRVKKGDTIRKLAARYYGNPKFAGDLLKAQSAPFKRKHRDVGKALPVTGLGSRVRIP